MGTAGAFTQRPEPWGNLAADATSSGFSLAGRLLVLSWVQHRFKFFTSSNTVFLLLLLFVLMLIQCKMQALSIKNFFVVYPSNS